MFGGGDYLGWVLRNKEGIVDGFIGGRNSMDKV